METKRIPDVGYTIDMDNAVIPFVVKDRGTRTLDMTKVHQDIIKRAAYVGLAQVRVVDKAAIMRARKDGTVKTAEEMLDEKWAAVQAICDHLESGTAEWGMRVAKAKPETDHSLTLRAMAEVSGKTVEEANAIVDRRATSLSVSRTAVLDAVLARDARVSAKVAEYRAARVVDVDVDGWEDELAGE